MNTRAIVTIAAVALTSALVAAVLFGPMSYEAAPDLSQEPPLPRIAPAPPFELTSQDATTVSLADLRGKVVAVTFIFTGCAATCPVLTPMMSLVQERLGNDFGSKVVFASITVDPERDTPEMLKLYAQMHGTDVPGWRFLTGPVAAIADITRRYGAYAAKNENGEIEHSFLTSIIDRRGVLRVQYLGVRFDPEEFRRDLVSLIREP